MRCCRGILSTMELRLGGGIPPRFLLVLEGDFVHHTFPTGGGIPPRLPSPSAEVWLVSPSKGVTPFGRSFFHPEKTLGPYEIARLAVNCRPPSRNKHVSPLPCMYIRNARHRVVSSARKVIHRTRGNSSTIPGVSLHDSRGNSSTTAGFPPRYPGGITPPKQGDSSTKEGGFLHHTLPEAFPSLRFPSCKR